MTGSEDSRVRLDKWLWAARFFKTRALATDAVNGGKVHLAGQRVKPSRAVRVGDVYEVQRGFERWQIEVVALAARRGSAQDAARLYRETGQSADKRAREAEQRKLAMQQRPRPASRPNKKERRQIRRFVQKA